MCWEVREQSLSEESIKVEPCKDCGAERTVGKPCRVLARGRGPGPRNVLVEFEDGRKFVSHRYAVQRLART